MIDPLILWAMVEDFFGTISITETFAKALPAKKIWESVTLCMYQALLEQGLFFGTENACRECNTKAIPFV